MDKEKKNVSLSWEDFQAMGNPENVPETTEESPEEQEPIKSKMVVRVYLERKNRGGKTATIIKGLELYDDELETLAKKLKSSLGIGGAVKDGEIVLQGDKRIKTVEYLKKQGYSNTKNAGA